jgi:Flp pilus assembly protein TadG
MLKLERVSVKRRALVKRSQRSVSKRVEPSGARARQRLGQSLVETMAGFILLIPLGLFSYDLTYILIANQNNEKLADNAARAAANHADNSSAQLAAQQAIADFQLTANYGKTTLTDFEYNIGDSGQVSVVTQIDAKLPVSFGSWKSVSINAKGVQPIVGIPTPR